MKQIHKQTLAEQDLIDIWIYSYHQWGENQADKYLDELDVAIKALASSPLAYRERPEFSPPVRVCHHASHLVIYRLVDKTVNIIRVLHESMDIDRHLID